MPLSRSPERPGTGHETPCVAMPTNTARRAEEEAARANPTLNVPGPEFVDAQGEVAALSSGVRIPPFWKDNPIFWFMQVEAVFALHRINGDESRFRYVIVHIDQNCLPIIADLLTNPPDQGKYAKVKERLISVLGESSTARIRRLLGTHVLGDEKPSVFLQRLSSLAQGQVSDEILRTIFMQQLPENVRAILAISEAKDVEKLAAQADKIMETAKPVETNVYVAKVEPNNAEQGTELAELRAQIDQIAKELRRRPRSRSRGRANFRNYLRNKTSERYCYYHHKFGNKAFKCAAPCDWNNNKKPEN